MKHRLIFLLFVLASGNGLTQNAHPGGQQTSLSADVESSLERHTGLVYAQYGDRKLELDLYRPKSAGTTKLPAIVCIHGGGWWRGTRGNHGNLAKGLAANGFVAVTITYRLSGEAPFPAAIQDCKAAVRFLRANAAKYGINPEKIGAIGLSAGGHLTALLGTSGGIAELEGEGGNAEYSSAIQAAVPLGAQTDFRRHHDNIEKSDPNPTGEKPNIWLQFLDAKPSEASDRWKLASPITHLDGSDPPMHFVTGENDNDSTHAAKFRSKMKQLEIAEGLTVISGAPHAFPGRQKWFDEMLVVATAWFKEHLSDRSFAPLLEFAEDRVSQGKVAGGTFLLMHRGDVVFREAFGYSDLEKKIPFKKTDSVVIASISKPMLATALFRLSQKDKLDLTAPIDQYLEEYKNAELKNGQPLERLPNTWELLTHTAGALSFYSKGGRPWFANWTKGKSLAEVVAGYSRDIPFQNPPGEKYAYSGIGTDIAARVGEVASGSPRNDYFQSELAIPLGLSATGYSEKDRLPASMPTRYYISEESGKLLKRKKRDVPGKNVYSSSGGAVISNASDLATWLQMISQKGVHNGKPFLEPATFAEFFAKAPKGSAIYGGFHVRESDARGVVTAIGHSGSSGTDCWIDYRNDTIGILLTQSGGKASGPIAKKMRSFAREWASGD